MPQGVLDHYCMGSVVSRSRSRYAWSSSVSAPPPRMHSLHCSHSSTAASWPGLYRSPAVALLSHPIVLGTQRLRSRKAPSAPRIQHSHHAQHSTPLRHASTRRQHIAPTQAQAQPQQPPPPATARTRTHTDTHHHRPAPSSTSRHKHSTLHFFSTASPSSDRRRYQHSARRE